MEIIDISLPIFDGMPVYPGTSETRIKSFRSASGQSTLSELQITSHAGTHVDAPAHVSEAGDNLSQLDLSIFYGPARVLDLTDCYQAINVSDLEDKNIKPGERILFKTANSKRGFDNIHFQPFQSPSNATAHQPGRF
jgi:arylformamidase